MFSHCCAPNSIMPPPELCNLKRCCCEVTAMQDVPVSKERLLELCCIWVAEENWLLARRHPSLLRQRINCGGPVLGNELHDRVCAVYDAGMRPVVGGKVECFESGTVFHRIRGLRLPFPSYVSTELRTERRPRAPACFKNQDSPHSRIVDLSTPLA